MPSFVTPGQVVYAIVDGTPSITVRGVDTAAAEGWSVLNRTTLIVVDGPGEEGFVTPRMGQSGDLTPPGWDDAVEAAQKVAITFRSSDLTALAEVV